MTNTQRKKKKKKKKMVRYAVTPSNPTKTCKASGAYLRVHFKNTHEAAKALKGMKLKKAVEYLNAVKEQKRCIPFKRFAGGVGRTAQAKEFGVTKGRWPIKSVNFLLDLLKNVESNAEAKGLKIENLIVSHIQVNRAPYQRRRTYRAHGRIGPYMSSPCHIELIVSEKEDAVPREKETKEERRQTRRRIALQRPILRRKAANKKEKAAPAKKEEQKS